MGPSQWLTLCKVWCDNYFPPATIDANIVGTLQELKADGAALPHGLAIIEGRLLLWVQTATQKLAEYAACGAHGSAQEPGMDAFCHRFSSTLEHMADVLATKTVSSL